MAHASNAAKDIFRWAEKQGIQIPEFTAPATKWVEPSEFATLYFRERKAHFSKREDAAEKLYIHSDKLAEIERGKEDPTRQEIERMENAFMLQSWVHISAMSNARLEIVGTFL